MSMTDESLIQMQHLLTLLSQRLSAEWMLAASVGALVGLARARLLTAACLAAGGLGGWMIATGVGPEDMAPELLLGLTVLAAVGVLEAVVVLIGGRDAAPQFWGTVFAALLAFILLFPLRAAGRVAAFLPGGRVVKALLQVMRR